MRNGEHKYFWFQADSNGSASLFIEYPAAGASKYGPYLLKKIYLGNNNDMSKAVNGWMPSKLNLKELFQSDSTWMHSSTWGKEAYRIVDMPGLVDQFKSAMQVIAFMDSRFRTADKMDMAKISQMANDPAILAQIAALANWASNVDVVNSPIYKASVEIENETKD